MKKNKQLEWNVFVEDFNTKQIKKYNVFNSEFNEELLKKIKKKEINTYGELKEFLKRWFMYRYWCKCEWEVLIGGLFADIKDFIKVDVWQQLLINLDRITEYVIRELEIQTMVSS